MRSWIVSTRGALPLTLALLAGALQGLPVAGDSPQAAAGARREAETQGDMSGTGAPAAPDFRSVVKSVVTSVVTVRSQRTVEVPRSPFFLPGPLGDLFGDDSLDQPRERRPRGDRRVERGLGSGVVVDAQGYILTNNHVILGTDRIDIVLADGRTVPATVKGSDPQTDLAVLKVEAAGLTPVRMGSSEALEVGEWVLAVGNPFGQELAHTVTAGIVSAKGRSNLNLAAYEDFIQTDAAINPGNSGGALVNTRGELVGINTAIITGSGGSQGVGFAIPVDMARRIMDVLIRTGKVVRGLLGVDAQSLTPEMVKALGVRADRGALVADVKPDGPASEAGLKRGDVIVELDGKTVSDGDDLRNRIAATAPGTVVTLTVERDGHNRQIKATLAERPDGSESGLPQPEDSEGGIGLSARTLTPELADRLGMEGERGVLVSDVEPGSSADSAGLRRGDVIQEVNRIAIASVADLREELARQTAQDVVLLLVRRGPDTFYVTVGRR